MIKPSQADLRALFAFLENQPRDFRPICRWLVLGPEMAKILVADYAHAPELDEVLDLVRWIEERAPELRTTVAWLAAGSPHAEVLRRELQLDFLLQVDDDSWTHPVQVLPKPRCTNADLLTACRQRRRKAEGRDKERLVKVEEKLLRAAQIDERARRRRLDQRRKEELAQAERELAEHEGDGVH